MNYITKKVNNINKIKVIVGNKKLIFADNKNETNQYKLLELYLKYNK